MTEPGNVWADWVTIWQSEMAAMAADREVQEAIQRGIDLWAAQTLALDPRPGSDSEARSAGPDAPAGAAPAQSPSGHTEQPAPASARA